MAKRTRREFLESAVFGAVGAGVALTAFPPGFLLAEPQATDRRSYTAGKYAVELDGVMAGWVQSVEGGHATSDVVTEKIGNDPLQKKHIAGVKYEDITVNCGVGMSRGFYEWIRASLDRQYPRKNGAIAVCDYDSKEISRLEWTQGLISEVGFPALDAASKDAAKMTVKITPESTRSVKGSGRIAAAAKLQAAQKKWVPANFRLQIGTLDCTRVNKIEALTIKQKVVENPVGEMRNYQKEPANAEVPNLAITLPEEHAAAFDAWHKSFVIQGKDSQGSKKNGQLDYLTPDLREVLFTLTFKNLGIFKLTPEKTEAGSENIRRVRAEMYCEEIRFSYGSGAAWA